jgi:phospholipase C
MAYSPFALRALVALVLLSSPGACRREPLPGYRPDSPVGAAAIALHGPSTVEAIRMALTGPGGVNRTEEVVATGGTAPSTITALPEGNGYLVTASARAVDGATCAGASALFSIVGEQTTAVSLSLTCSPPGNQIDQIGHIVVIYMENHSFDSLYGSFPGVEGLSSPTANIAQIDDATGLPYPTLPQTDTKIPLDLPNRPFDLSAYIPPDMTTADPVHRFYEQQWQINGGRMDRFATVSNVKGLVMAYYPTANLPVARLALDNPTQTTICDHFFHAAFGGSFLNHHWLIAAATPVFPNAPEDTVITFDDAGNLVNNGSVTPDGFVVIGIEPSANPHSPGAAPERLVPPQVAPTIGDRLTAAGVDWAWYAGGWSNAAGLVDAPGWTNGPGPDCADENSFANPSFPYCPDYLFQFHHQPFAYYSTYGPDGPGRAHLQDEESFLDLATSSSKSRCNLKPVSFVKPIGEENEHPGYTGEHSGSTHLVELLTDIQSSACRKDTMVIVTYDEFGGQWDHVPPPGQGGAPGPHDEWGPGTRIPTLVITPHLRGTFVVDHTQHDTTSILATIEHRFGLAPLASRDAAIRDLSTVFGAKR